MITITKSNSDNDIIAELSEIYGFVTDKDNVYIFDGDDNYFILYRDNEDFPYVEEISENVITLKDFKEKYFDRNEHVAKIFESREDFKINVII